MKNESMKIYEKIGNKWNLINDFIPSTMEDRIIFYKRLNNNILAATFWKYKSIIRKKEYNNYNGTRTLEIIFENDSGKKYKYEFIFEEY